MQTLSGVADSHQEPVRIRLSFENQTGSDGTRVPSLYLHLEWGWESAVYWREAPRGLLREAIRFYFPGGTRTVFFQVRLSELTSAPLLNVEPLRIDLGVVRPGQEVRQQVLLTNRGREILSWKTGLAGTKGFPAKGEEISGRYLSFRRTPATGANLYPYKTVSGEGIELLGAWTEEGGYPLGQGEQSRLRFRFTGSGINLLFWKTPEGGLFNVFIGERFVAQIDGYADHREMAEVAVAGKLPDGPHLLTVINESGKVLLEGVRLFGRPVLKGPRGWISVFPDSGSTTRETDYVTIALRTRDLPPGIYGERVYFTSNGGDRHVEFSLEVAVGDGGAQSNLREVLRYVSGSDYLLTTNPSADTARLESRGYQYSGVAFRLFSPGTAGTAEFLRWFNPTRGDYYYTTDSGGGGKALDGYLLEGSIGRIATVRLPGTRALYRWHNPSTGRYFYTTDQDGEGFGKKGYRFDGIAGYVR